MDTPTIEVPKPDASKLTDGLGLYIGLGLAFLAGGVIGMKLAQKFIVPPQLPAVPKPCSDCERRKAEAVEASIQAEREAVRAQEQARVQAMVEHPLTDADFDGPEETPQFDHTKVENPKTFSPVGPASDNG